MFGPVEAARTERLSAKLQELAAQPRPESNKMDITVESEGELVVLPPKFRDFLFPVLSNAPFQPDATVESSTKQNESSKKGRTFEGSLPCISCSIPKSLSYPEDDEGSVASGVESTGTTMSRASSPEDDAFYNFLGVCSDVVGFDKSGELLLSPIDGFASWDRIDESNG